MWPDRYGGRPMESSIFGFIIKYSGRQQLVILALSIHYSRASDLIRPDHLVTQPANLLRVLDTLALAKAA